MSKCPAIPAINSMVYFLGNIPRKYGQKYGTNVPPFFLDPGDLPNQSTDVPNLDGLVPVLLARRLRGREIIREEVHHLR